MIADITTTLAWIVLIVATMGWIVYGVANIRKGRAEVGLSLIHI